MAKIGMVTICFERGQSYVTQVLRRALIELGHTPYMFVRQGAVYGMPMRETTGAWAWDHRTDYPTYEIAPSALEAWAMRHKLDAVLFNEEYQFDLPMVLRQAGIRTIHYMDFLAPHWRPLLKFYDQLWTATGRTLGILSDWGKERQTHFIGWGVHSAMIGAHASMLPRFDLMSNQGWIGINARKGLDQLLSALWVLQDTPPEVLIHAQMTPEQVCAAFGWEEGLPPHIIWEDATVPPPGLYHTGRVVVQPSKLEGLGLTLVEAMAAGRPMITTDHPPMNEWVTPDTGWLVPVDRLQSRADGILFQEALIAPEVLAKVMQEAINASDAVIAEKCRLTLARAHELFDWTTFKARISLGLERIGC